MERQLLRRRRAARLGWACKEGRGQWPARAMREHRCFLRKRVSSRVWCCCSRRSRLGKLEPAVDVQSCPVQSGDGKMFWGWHLHLQLWRQVSGGRRRGQSTSQPANEQAGTAGSAAISKPAQPSPARLNGGPHLALPSEREHAALRAAAILQAPLSLAAAPSRLENLQALGPA